MKNLNVQLHAERYSELRKALGFKFRESSLIQQFVHFLESQNGAGPIRAAMALEWAISASPTCGRVGQVQRLTVARHFLIYLKAFLSDTEIRHRGCWLRNGGPGHASTPRKRLDGCNRRRGHCGSPEA